MISRGKALVAGATGYLGRYLVVALKESGWRVRVLVRSSASLSNPGPALAPVVTDYVDEIREGDVTKPETLDGLCSGIDVAISTVSLMSDSGPMTWDDVDFRGNRNLLREAIAAGVGKMGYVSVFNAERMLDIPMVTAHEAFVNELVASGLEYLVVRPTAYFSDMGAILEMARSGRVFLPGTGGNPVNPIHGADLAEFCVGKLLQQGSGSFSVGGPQTLTPEQIAGLAFRELGMRPRITRVPVWTATAALALYRLINRKAADLAKFFVGSGALDFQAPAFGTRRLADHFRAIR